MSNLPLDLYKDLYKNNIEKFEQYQSLILKWNEKINLTALTSPDEIRELHFIDSLMLVPQIVSRETLYRDEKPLTLLDIGSGAGFPGIPLKIALPSLKVTLVDSVKKKCDFMKTVIRELALKDITVLHKTLTANDPLGKFDVITSRAAFRMAEFIQLAAPHLANHGTILALKGSDIADEIKECELLLSSLHFNPIQEIDYELPQSGKKRKIVKCFT